MVSGYQKAIRSAGKDPNRKILYEIHPGPQTRFMESSAEEVLYGGAYAGGKSLGLRAWGVNYCMAYPGAQVVLFRRSYRELEDTHVLTLQQEVPLGVAKYSSGSHNLIFNNGSILFLRYCETDADVACVGVETPILTEDLRWVEAGTLRVGDQIVGFDENAPSRGFRRKLRKATITHQNIVDAPTYQITLETGETIFATPEHKWLVRLPGKGVVWRRTDLIYKRYKAGLSVNLRRFIPWKPPLHTYEQGFLSAAFDGEGSLCNSRGNGHAALSLTFVQKDNPMLYQVRDYLDLYGIHPLSLTSAPHAGRSDVRELKLTGNARVISFLSTMQPPRLLEKWTSHLDGSRVALPHTQQTKEQGVGDVRIVEMAGPLVREISELSTSTGTYIAEGFGAHNTYHTSEFDAMLFDEITQFTEYQYLGLISRCRSAKPWWPGPRIRVAGTPVGIGMSWVKARWVENSKWDVHHEPNSVWKAPMDEGGFTRQFIPAKVQDNPTLMEADPGYVDRLKALPYEEYKARALGDWNVFTGQFFVRWRNEYHVVEPFDIPPDWDKWLLHDYGFNAPFASLWVARPPAAQSLWVYREQYGKGVELDEQVTLAWDITKDSSETLRGVVLDPSLFNKVNVKGERIKPMADHWREKFGKVTNIYRGNNERVSGWRLFRTLLDWEEAPTGGLLIPPRIFFFKSCPNSIRSIPDLVCDKVNLEDVDTKGEDHAADAIRYGIQHIFAGSGRNDLTTGFRLTPKGVVAAR